MIFNELNNTTIMATKKDIAVRFKVGTPVVYGDRITYVRGYLYSKHEEIHYVVVDAAPNSGWYGWCALEYNAIKLFNGHQIQENEKYELVEEKYLKLNRDLLLAWEQFKKSNWWESEAVDVEKLLMARFARAYNR